MTNREIEALNIPGGHEYPGAGMQINHTCRHDMMQKDKTDGWKRRAGKHVAKAPFAAQLRDEKDRWGRTQMPMNCTTLGWLNAAAIAVSFA